VNYLSLYTDAREILARVKEAKADGKITSAEMKIIGNAACTMALDVLGHDPATKMDGMACLSAIVAGIAGMAKAKTATPAAVLVVVEAALVGVQNLLLPQA
jgi:hypothetical protein